MKKKIHIPKSKAELIADLQKSSKWVAKMKFTRDQFYPALLELNSSIDETKTFLASINSVLMEKFLGKMKELKMSDDNLKQPIKEHWLKKGQILTNGAKIIAALIICYFNIEFYIKHGYIMPIEQQKSLILWGLIIFVLFSTIDISLIVQNFINKI